MNLLIAAATLSAVIITAVPKPAAVTSQAAGGTLFFDDFTSADLDRSKWTPEVWGHTVNDEQQAYIDSRDVISISRGDEGAENGALVIAARHRPGYVAKTGRKFDFVSGRLITRGHFEFTYGTAAARMKLPAGAGLWPAFWALGAGEWPDTGEIDIMENVGDPAWTSVALHGPGYSGNTPLVDRFRFAAGQDATSWHVYSVDWGPGELVFRVDDAQVYRVSRGDVERHGRWAFDNPKYLIINLALGGNYPFSVNRVTTPYHGLPAATVQSIEAGRARVLVDWVRVTRR